MNHIFGIKFIHNAIHPDENNFIIKIELFLNLKLCCVEN